jgi:ABC-type multidrug transport system ATPase subunit
MGLTVQDQTIPQTAGPHFPVNLTADGLHFAWRGQSVLCGVDVALRAGTLTELRGANGAGKTTLIRLLAGGLEPQAGRVLVGGLDLRTDRRACLRRIGVAATGDRGLYARLDVRANLELAAGLALLPRATAADLVDRALARFELGALERRRGDRLSLGQRQRVRLAIAFLHEPDVLLLDEPAASLDPDGCALLARALGELSARGGSALWAAPRAVAVELPADRRLLLEAGTLREAA